MRILHLPTSVGGNAYGLSRGERAMGHTSEVLVTEENFFNYPADHVLFSRPSSCRMQSWLRRARLFKTFLSIRNAYDVFHFNFGQSLLHFERLGLPFLELPFYSGKAKIIVTYNGCDARQKFKTIEMNPYAPCHDPNCYGGVCNSGKKDMGRWKAIARMNKYAHMIFALNPDLLHVLPGRARFLPYTVAAWNDIASLPIQQMRSPLRIAHAPTNRVAKGSDAVFSAIEQLQREYGQHIEFVLIEGVSYKEALALYASADLVIDQLRIGWYGGLAVEAMKMGRPVVVYIREEDLHFIPRPMAEQLRDAVFNATETTLLNTLRGIVENPHVLHEKANAGLAYVHQWHDPVKVAAISLEAYGDCV